MDSRKGLAAAAAAALALQPAVAAAQQTCITEAEVSAMAIYSVPSLVQSVRLRCAGELLSSGFLARRGDAFIARYTGLQDAVWPRAKSGLLKFGARRAGSSGPGIDTFANLPDNAVRPLIDALIAQEVSGKIQPRHCGRIERVLEAAAPIDPEVAGTLIGVIIGLVAPEDPPICPARRS
ncbi:MAG TPA: hypothetical protein VEB68_13460 [Croceibacterium sp.]|nr:hypothetical protein [Croceibacterium sp.]